MHGDRGNRRTEKATSQNIFEMTKIRDRSFVTSRGGGGGEGGGFGRGVQF